MILGTEYGMGRCLICGVPVSTCTEGDNSGWPPPECGKCQRWAAPAWREVLAALYEGRKPGRVTLAALRAEVA